MDGDVGHQQPCYSSYIDLRNVGLTSSTAVSGVRPSTDELGLKPVLLRRSRTSVSGCKHFPEVEVQSEANWSCEFCDGAKLIEQASRSNEAVSSLDMEKLLGLLSDCNTSCECVAETSGTRNAVESNCSQMGSWILGTRARDAPANEVKLG